LDPRGSVAAASRDENASAFSGFRFAAASPFRGDALDALNAAAAARICGSREGRDRARVVRTRSARLFRS